MKKKNQLQRNADVKDGGGKPAKNVKAALAHAKKLNGDSFTVLEELSEVATPDEAVEVNSILTRLGVIIEGIEARIAG